MESTTSSIRKALSSDSLTANNTSNTNSTEQNNNTDKTTDSTAGNSDFSDYMLKALSVTEGQDVSEEELFAGLISQRLNAKSDEAAEYYQGELAKFKTSLARSDGYVPVEDAANEALKSAVEAGKISKEEAEQIKGEAFAAAQLDDNKDALYDNRGSAEDPTIAVSKMEAALLSMRTLVEQIESGEVKIDPRSLDLGSTGGSSSTSGGDPAKAPTGAQQMDGAGGFVWKPVSESNGKLAVLLPESFNGVLDHIEIMSADGMELTSVDYTKDYDDGRPLFRFDKAGEEYGDNIKVVAYKTDGETVSWDISNGAVRHD
ncbi:MAG: hypothetical protein IT292_03610 [Deltaproteobacteria bacterium]|nr:hypothetical protein [Deltaproteobacteria bacterium]